jgi:uncharacterized protein (TIGR00288 family)
MANPPDDLNLALFCDFENVALGVRDAKYDKFDINRVLERLLLKGSIVVKKAYCDWERYKEFKTAMHGASFELIEIPHVRQSGKNSADIRMVVDALDLCYTKAHVDTFVIISGDSDFSPLVSKLRENNKTVIGVGVKSSTSDLLINNCDEFIFYDDLVRDQQRRKRAPAKRKAAGAGPARGGAKPAEQSEPADAQNPADAAERDERPEQAQRPARASRSRRSGQAARADEARNERQARQERESTACDAATPDEAPFDGAAPEAAPVERAGARDERYDQDERDNRDERDVRGDEAPADRKQEAFDLVTETLDALIAERGADEQVWGSMIKQTLKRRKPGFNEGYYGFRSFNALLEEAQAQHLLQLKRDDKSGGYLVRPVAG